jgi:ribulose 1,5-bisphosphate carboxylase large subunit-like protein
MEKLVNIESKMELVHSMKFSDKHKRSKVVNRLLRKIEEETGSLEGFFVISAFSDVGIVINKEQVQEIKENTIFLALYSEHYTLLEYVRNDLLTDINKLYIPKQSMEKSISVRSVEMKDDVGDCKEEEIVYFILFSVHLCQELVSKILLTLCGD